MHNKALWLSLACVFVGVGPVWGGSVDLAVDNVGLSIGNSKHFTGLRINFSDERVERVNGINLTLWKPGDNPHAEIQGLQLGLVGIDARELRGIMLTGVGLGAERVAGVAVGLIGIGGETSVTGIGIGGVGLGGGDLNGIMLGGVGLGADDLSGIGVGGLGVGGDNMKGLFAGAPTISYGTPLRRSTSSMPRLRKWLR